jgi:hypothetical protein
MAEDRNIIMAIVVAPKVQWRPSSGMAEDRKMFRNDHATSRPPAETLLQHAAAG